MNRKFTINNVILASFLQLSFNRKDDKMFSGVKPSKKALRNIMAYSKSLQVVHSEKYGALTYHSN